MDDLWSCCWLSRDDSQRPYWMGVAMLSVNQVTQPPATVEGSKQRTGHGDGDGDGRSTN